MPVSDVADFALKLMRDTHISFIRPAVGTHVQQKADNKQPRGRFKRWDTQHNGLQNGYPYKPSQTKIISMCIWG